MRVLNFLQLQHQKALRTSHATLQKTQHWIYKRQIKRCHFTCIFKKNTNLLPKRQYTNNTPTPNEELTETDKVRELDSPRIKNHNSAKSNREKQKIKNTD